MRHETPAAARRRLRPDAEVAGGTGAATYTDASVRTSNIFNYDCLTERHQHTFGDDASEHIAAAARRKRYDHRDGSRRISLCLRDLRQR